MSVVFLEGSGFRSSLERHPQCGTAIKEFRRSKLDNPLAPFGNSDYPFSNEGHFRGYLHAKMTQDISLIYTRSGSDPRVFKLYGVYSHAELGTGNPANPRKQKSAAQSLHNQTFS